MAAELTTAKISAKSLRMLRLVAALTGERQYVVLERLLKAELGKLKARGDFDEQ
jgi:hypothetical protein